MTRVSVDAGALQMVLNALKRDAAEGKTIRGEMAAELEKTAVMIEPCENTSNNNLAKLINSVTGNPK